MSYLKKEDIRAGIFITKDSSIAVEVANSKPSLSEIARKLELVRDKLAIVQQFVADNKRRMH
jgi:hypothetical protein